jgi:hypothetical protein
MKSEELQTAIRIIENSINIEESSFGFFDIGHSPEYVLRANEDGLKYLALELLKALQIKDNLTANGEQPCILFSNESNCQFAESDIRLIGVEKIEGKLSAVTQQEEKESLSDKALSIGCVTILITMLVAMVIGFWKIFSLIF